MLSVAVAAPGKLPLDLVVVDLGAAEEILVAEETLVADETLEAFQVVMYRARLGLTRLRLG